MIRNTALLLVLILALFVFFGASCGQGGGDSDSDDDTTAGDDDTDDEDIAIVSDIFRRNARQLKSTVCLMRFTSDSILEVANEIDGLQRVSKRKKK